VAAAVAAEAGAGPVRAVLRSNSSPQLGQSVLVIIIIIVIIITALLMHTSYFVHRFSPSLVKRMTFELHSLTYR